MKFTSKALLFFLLTAGACSAFAQNGGKAEPKRIQFAAGSSSATVTGTLKNHQEMDYVFGATKGQTVTVTNPKWSQFDFRVFNAEHFDEGDFDSSRTYTFEIPATGDYLFTIRKKQTGSRSGRFSMSLTIK